MLEIIGIILLCNVNKKNAAARGERPGKYIGFTILLWVGAEIVGTLIGGAADMGMGVYVLALIFAGIGGILRHDTGEIGKNPVIVRRSCYESRFLYALRWNRVYQAFSVLWQSR